MLQLRMNRVRAGQDRIAGMDEEAFCGLPVGVGGVLWRHPDNLALPADGATESAAGTRQETKTREMDPQNK